MNSKQIHKKKIDLKKIIKGKTAVFIDAANILYSQKTLGWRVDYKKLQQLFIEKTNLSGIYFYTGKVGNQQKQANFIKKLKQIKFHVFSKEVKFIKLPQGGLLPKGNLDVELALDAYRLSDQFDTLVLFSGDSDFAYLLFLLKKKGKHLIVISTRGHVAVELLNSAKFIDLNKLKKDIIWKDS